MAESPPATEDIVLAHFIVSDDVERSRRFYTEVLGGRLAFSGDVTYVALSNSWIIINVGGGPTDDKPAVTLETPSDPDRVSSFLNIRVKDIHAVYAEWSARGAEFLTPPKQHEYEIRCYIRDPDGHLIEVGQTTDPKGIGPPIAGRRAQQVRSPNNGERGRQDRRGRRRRRNRQALRGADSVVLALRLSVLEAVISEITDWLTEKLVVVPSNPLATDAEGNIARLLPEGQSPGQVVARWHRRGRDWQWRSGSEPDSQRQPGWRSGP